MPTKKRREQAARGRQKREEDERAWAEFDAVLAALPPERRERLEAQAADFDPDEWGCPAYRNVGLTIDDDDETGEVWMHPKHGVGGNDRRAADKADAIRALEQKYREFWNVRNGAKRIARAEGLSVETVRRYFRETRKDDRPS
jgi:hypothetical protein